ncbi:MAG: hypothetical protein GY803_05800, partial [Chloroflexi bacterium]|nr:hypothetical protein [Chloroflexota bacterium]
AFMFAVFSFAPTAVHAAGFAAQAEGEGGAAIVLALLALILLLVAVVGVIGAVALGIIGIGYSTVTPDDE